MQTAGRYFLDQRPNSLVREAFYKEYTSLIKIGAGYLMDFIGFDKIFTLHEFIGQELASIPLQCALDLASMRLGVARPPHAHTDSELLDSSSQDFSHAPISVSAPSSPLKHRPHKKRRLDEDGSSISSNDGKVSPTQMRQGDLEHCFICDDEFSRSYFKQHLAAMHRSPKKESKSNRSYYSDLIRAKRALESASSSQ